MSWLPRQMGESVRMEVVKGGETNARGTPVGASTSSYCVFQGDQCDTSVLWCQACQLQVKGSNALVA